jgi:hypothetical protein
MEQKRIPLLFKTYTKSGFTDTESIIASLPLGRWPAESGKPIYQMYQSVEHQKHSGYH